jgi:hypothetical protein
MKNKILVTIMATMFATSLMAASAPKAAAPLSVSADATYYTKALDKGVLAYEDVVIAGVNVEAYGFVGGIKTFNIVQDRTVGKTVSSSGMLKRIDTILGYKFNSPLADLTLGGTYSSYSKSVGDGLASNTEPFAVLSGNLYKNAAWNVTGRADLKNRTNNLETTVKLPFGFSGLKVVPSIGYGFNDPGAATIAAFKSAKQYAVVGLGLGYYTKYATLSADVYQRRDSLFTAGDTINGVSAGLAVKF